MALFLAVFVLPRVVEEHNMNTTAPRRELTLDFDEVFPETLAPDITPTDCERGKRRDDYHCPTALAASRRFDGADVRVGSGWIEVRYAGQMITYGVPADLRRQIVTYDRGGEFLPGSFELTLQDRRPPLFAEAIWRAASGWRRSAAPLASAKTRP